MKPFYFNVMKNFCFIRRLMYSCSVLCLFKGFYLAE